MKKLATVSEIVRGNYRTADVFKKHGINFCCTGQVTLEEACTAGNVDMNRLLGELETATRHVSLPADLEYDKWKIDFLIDYIIHVHHAYISKALPVMEESLQSFMNSHQKQYPELKELLKAFRQLSAFLKIHNAHEEDTIFPYIKQIENTYRRREVYGRLFVRTLRKPLASIEKEHQQITELLMEMRRLTHHYTVPAQACNNHYVVYNKLAEFDNDLVQHKYLENNILFPRAIDMETQLLQL